MPTFYLFLIALIFLPLLSHGQKSERITFADSDFQLYRAPAQMVHLHWKSSEGVKYKTFSSLESDLQQRKITPLMMTNAGIYEKGETPCGLHIEGGQVLREINLRDQPGNFYLKPNGVFYIADGKAMIMESHQYTQKTVTPDLALQSGPLLLQNKKIHPKFNRDSKSKLLRSGVGITEDGQVIFAISQGKVNFHHFARLFLDLGCTDALFLDGTISKMQIGKTPASNTQNRVKDFAAIIAIYEK